MSKKSSKKQKFKRNKVVPDIGEIWSVVSYSKYNGFDPDVIAFKCNKRYHRNNTMYFEVEFFKGDRDDIPEGIWWSSYRAKNKWDDILRLSDIIQMKNNKIIQRSDEAWLAKKLLEGTCDGSQEK